MISLGAPTLALIGLGVALLGVAFARGWAARLARGAVLVCLAAALGAPQLDRAAPRATQVHLVGLRADRTASERAALWAALRSAQPPASLDEVMVFEVGERPAHRGSPGPGQALDATPPAWLATPPAAEGAAPALRWAEALAIAASHLPSEGELTVCLWGDLAGLRAADAAPFQQIGAALIAHPSPELGSRQLVGLALPDGPEVVAGGSLRVITRSSPTAAPGRLRAAVIDGAGARHPLGPLPDDGEAELSLPPAAAAGPARLLIEERPRPIAEPDLVITHSRALLLSRPPRVWLATSDRGEARSLAALLEGEGAVVRVIGPDALRAGALSALSAVDGADLLVLGGVSAQRISAADSAAIEAWVRSGGQLVVSGGAEGWELGGWDGAPLAPLLPLEADPTGATLDPAITILVVLDKSGSMARPALLGSSAVQESVTARMRGGRPEGSRIRLAAEGVVESVRRLRDNTDYVAVLGVDTKPSWVLRPTVVADREAIAAAARSLTAGGGGIYITTALEAAAPVILSATTPLKHVVLFADASDVGEQRRANSEAEAVRVVASLRRAGVTFSVVGIGGPGDRDLLYLQNLARVGGGQAWLAEDPRRLPGLFARETERLLGAPPPTTLALQVKAPSWSPALDRVRVDQGPRLPGHHRLRARPGAVVALSTEQGPVLAGTRVGLGQTWALATDLGARTARPWLSWSGWGTLWANLLRSSTSEAHDDPLGEMTVTVEPDVERPGRSVLRVEERDGLGRSRAPFNRSVTVRRADLPDGPATVVPLSVVAPGAWAASALLPANAVLALQPSEPDGSLGPAVLRVTADEDHLEALDPGVIPAFTSPGGPRATPTARLPLWWAFAALAALLLPVDAWARRHGLRAASAQKKA